MTRSYLRFALSGSVLGSLLLGKLLDACFDTYASAIGCLTNASGVGEVARAPQRTTVYLHRGAGLDLETCDRWAPCQVKVKIWF